MDVTKTHELLNRISGQGLSAEYKFTRSPCIYSSSMVSVEIIFKNSGSQAINNIHVGGKVRIQMNIHALSFLFLMLAI